MNSTLWCVSILKRYLPVTPRQRTLKTEWTQTEPRHHFCIFIRTSQVHPTAPGDLWPRSWKSGPLGGGGISDLCPERISHTDQLFIQLFTHADNGYTCNHHLNDNSHLLSIFFFCLHAATAIVCWALTTAKNMGNLLLLLLLLLVVVVTLSLNTTPCRHWLKDWSCCCCCCWCTVRVDVV